MSDAPTIRPKVYSYVRFSSPEQALGDSKRRQVDQARAWAVEHGMELDEELRDEGISGFRGANLQAEAALGSFFRAVQSGSVVPGSVLVVESLDRLSRDRVLYAMNTLSSLLLAGLKVVTLADRREYTEASVGANPMDLMASLLVFMRANEESELKAQRLRASWGNKRRLAVEKGERMTTVCPPWLTPEGEGFAIVADRAAIVRRIFEETLLGRGQHAIAERLTVEEVPTWRRGRVWHRTYVRKLLTNPAVMGTLELHETRREQGGGSTRTKVADAENYYPPIIDPETWERAQAFLRERGAPRGRNAGKAIRHLLANLARCPVCEGPMTRTFKGKSNGRPYLVCTLAKTKGRCVHKNVPAAAVDEAIFRGFAKLALDTPAAGAAEAALANDLAALDAEMDAVTEELEDIRAARRQRQFTPAHHRRETELYAQLRDIEERQEAARKEIANASSPIVEARLERVLEQLEAGPQDDLTLANAALREAFKEVVVDYRDGTLGFRWRHGGETWITYDYSVSFAQGQDCA